MLHIAVLLFFSLCAHCAQVPPFLSFSGHQLSKTDYPMLAALRLLSAVHPTINPLQFGHLELSLTVVKAVQEMHAGEVEAVLESKSKLEHLLDGRVKLDDPVELYQMLRGALECALPPEIEDATKEYRGLAETLKRLNPKWELLGEPFANTVTIMAGESTLVRRWIPFDGKRYGLTHALTRHSEWKFDIETHSVLAFDLHRNTVTIESGESQMTGTISNEDGAKMLPSGHTPVLLVYKLDEEGVPVISVPKWINLNQKYEHLRAPLHVLCGVFADIHEVEAVGNDLVTVLKAMRQRITIDQDMLGRLGEVTDRSAMEIMPALLRRLPDEYRRGRVSQMTTTRTAQCMLCGSDPAIPDITQPHVNLTLPLQNKLATTLTLTTTSLTDTDVLYYCTSCDCQTTHRFYKTRLSALSSLLFIQLDRKDSLFRHSADRLGGGGSTVQPAGGGNCAGGAR